MTGRARNDPDQERPAAAGRQVGGPRAARKHRQLGDRQPEADEVGGRVGVVRFGRIPRSGREAAEDRPEGSGLPGAEAYPATARPANRWGRVTGLRPGRRRSRLAFVDTGDKAPARG